MDLKFTKVTPQKFIAKLLPLMGPLDTIASVSQEYVNTSNVRAKFALECELKVIKKYQSLGYELLYHRKKYDGVEVDIILYHQIFGVVLLEVKSNRADWGVHERVNATQLKRLYSVYLKIRNVVGSNVDARILLVGKSWQEHKLVDLISSSH